MKIQAQLLNAEGTHKINLMTDQAAKTISIPPKTSGRGSSINGGELLFLAIATCYCNDVYREAEKRKIRVTSVDVRVTGDFGREGEPATNISYSAHVTADARQEDIDDLLRHTDTVAEIQNTLRAATPVVFNRST